MPKRLGQRSIRLKVTADPLDAAVKTAELIRRGGFGLGPDGAQKASAAASRVQRTRQACFEAEALVARLGPASVSSEPPSACTIASWPASWSAASI